MQQCTTSAIVTITVCAAYTSFVQLCRVVLACFVDELGMAHCDIAAAGRLLGWQVTERADAHAAAPGVGIGALGLGV